MGVVYSLLSLVVMALFGKPLALLFVDAGETEIIDQAYQYLVINAACFIPLAGVNIFRLLIQGMGYSKVAVFAGVFEMVAGGPRACFGAGLRFFGGLLCRAHRLGDGGLFSDPAYVKVMKHVKQYGY